MPTLAVTPLSTSDPRERALDITIEKVSHAFPCNCLSALRHAYASRYRLAKLAAVAALAWVGVFGAGAATAQTGLDFDGVNDYVTFGQASSLGLQTFTIECWFKREGAGVTTSTGTGGITSVIPLVTKGRGESDGGTFDMNYFLGIRSTDNVLGADFEDNATGANHPVFGVTAIGTGTWYHAAATYDGTIWRLYLNGGLEATATVNFTPQNLSVQHAGIATGLTTTGAAAGFFNGVIDEVRIWSVARTQPEIAAALDEEFTSAPGLVGRWGLNEGSGATAANSGTASGVNGTLVNGPVWVPGSPFALPDALDFPGTNAYVNFGAPASLALANFTLEMWVRRDGAGVGTNTGTGGVPDIVPLISKGRADAEVAAQDINYIFGIRASDGVLAADFEEGAGGTTPSLNHPVTGATPLVTGTWYHAAATYDGTTWKLYRNGVLDGQLAVGQPAASGSNVSVALGSALTLAGVASGFFDGAVDEVRVWNVARTSAEINSAINSRLTSPTAGLVARWGLDEAVGTTVHSTAGTTLDGTIAGTGWSWATGAPFDVGPLAPPNAPSGLVAVAHTASQVELSWIDNSSNEASFELERSTNGSGGPFSPLASVSVNQTTYTDGTVAPSNEYCYRVVATNAAGSSTPSNVACATPLVSSGTALHLGGADAYVSFGNVLKLTQFTLELWFRRDATGTGTNTGSGGIPDLVPFIAKGRADAEVAAQDINYIFGIRASDGVLAADFEEGAAGASPSLNHPVAGLTAVTIGGWHHGAVTYDGATWKLYLDGIPETQLAVGQPAGSGSDVAVSLGSALTLAGAASGFFNGAMDEVRVWNVARTQAEIQATANVQITVAQPGLVARWGLDEGSGTAVNGSAGTALNGTIVGASYTWSGGAPFNLSFNQAPTQPVLVVPPNAATAVARPPTLSVTASDADADDLTVTFYGRPAGNAGPDFTLIGLPDTQYYTGQLNGGTPAMLNSQTQWIVDNLATRNIVYAVQLGDCVEHGDNGGDDIEWQRADTGFSLIENALTTGLPDGVPYGICVGNHDQSPIGDADGTTTFYNQYFGVARFQGRAYYGGHHGSNNDNWYDLFSASGMDFISIGLEYDTTPDAAVLTWADQLLTTYSNRRAIVSSHNLLGTGNPGSFSTQGSAVYNALRGHSNLFLMLCGHVPGEGRRQDTFSGNTVHTVMSDYQGRTNGGDGWLRIMEFSPSSNVIRVRTYSPWLDQFEADPDSSSQFTLAYPMSASGPFQVIGTAHVPSGGTAQFSWAGLAADTEYEWYVTVNDGNATTTGPVWRFTTAEGVSPTVQVLSPNGGESVTVGAITNLTWDASDNVAVTSVDLMLSRAGAGGPFEVLATDVANTGAYTWTATGPPTASALFKVVARDAAANTGNDVSDAPFMISAPSGVAGMGMTEFALSAVAPNPAHGVARMVVTVPREAEVRVQILDVQGRVVATIMDGVHAAGRRGVAWRGSGAAGQTPPGMYVVRLQAAGKTFTRRFLLLN